MRRNDQSAFRALQMLAIEDQIVFRRELRSVIELHIYAAVDDRHVMLILEDDVTIGCDDRIAIDHSMRITGAQILVFEALCELAQDLTRMQWLAVRFSHFVFFLSVEVFPYMGFYY